MKVKKFFHASHGQMTHAAFASGRTTQKMLPTGLTTLVHRGLLHNRPDNINGQKGKAISFSLQTHCVHANYCHSSMVQPGSPCLMCHVKPAHLPTETRPLCQTWCANLGNQNCVCVWVVVFYVLVVLLGYSYMDIPTETRYFLS